MSDEIEVVSKGERIRQIERSSWADRHTEKEKHEPATDERGNRIAPDWSDMSREEIRQKASGYLGRINLLEEEVSELTADALDRMKGAHENSDVWQTVRHLIENRISDLAQEIADTEETVSDLKSKLESAQSYVNELREDLEEEKQANTELRDKVANLHEEKIDPPTRDEMRAALELGVSISQLRRWRRAERGPQPPYDNLEEWEVWVTANKGESHE